MYSAKFILGSCVVGLGALGVASCGKSADDTVHDIKNGVANLLKTGAIVGSWEGPCDKSEILNLGGRASLKFSPNDFQREVQLFGNDKCESFNISVITSGEFTLGSGEGYPEKVYPVDYHFNKVVVKPLTDAGVKALESGALCGVKDWKVNEEKDLTSVSGKLGCVLPAMPSSVFDVVRVDDKTLKTGALGLPFAPNKAESRPKDVSNVTFTRK